MRYFVLAIIVLATLGFLTMLGEKKGEESPAAKKAGEPAPVFSLNDYHGNKVSLSDFAGKNVVVNSWAAWCPFCVLELKDFAQLQEELGDAIVIIAIDRAELLETARGYTDDTGVSDKLVFLLDPADSFYKSIGGSVMPETIFVNDAGEIVFHKRGPMSLEEMRIKVKEVLSM